MARRRKGSPPWWFPWLVLVGMAASGSLLGLAFVAAE